MNIAWLPRSTCRSIYRNQAGSATLIALCVAFGVMLLGVALTLVAQRRLYDVHDYERMTMLRYQAESQLEAQANELERSSLTGTIYKQNVKVTVNGDYLKLETIVNDEKGGEYTRYGLMKKEGANYVWQGWSR